MIFENLTIDDVKTAYRKLKSLSYYDSHDLFLKAKIASFETTFAMTVSKNIKYKLANFEEKLNVLHKELTSEEQTTNSKYWNNLYKKIDYRVLPKKVKSYSDYSKNNSQELINNIFTNVREIDEDSKYEFEKLTFYIDAPIEIHIVSILWIMKIGYILESDLDEKCYGNRLILEKKKANSKEETVKNDNGLFKPYYKQYQKWRDEGITVAKQYLDKKQDVLFINIDIKDYYYSVRFEFDKLNARLKNKQINDWNKLNSVFREIHEVYTQRIKSTNYPNDLIKNIEDNETVLPIGLASSYILANWYLHEFDSRVYQNIRPIYYSRYVDDIFIITANPNTKFTAEETCDKIQADFYNKHDKSYIDNLKEEEQYIIKTLYPVITLEDTPIALTKVEPNIGNKIFKIECYKNLYIQPSKTLVYYFRHDSTLAMLEKFKHEMEKRSSEFRFLPDEKLEENGFDEEAYELVFDDSIHKVKTLKDYKESRYGIASHLSKKIFYSLRNGKKNTKEDAEKILKFFKGTTNLEHFRQWERLITYFVVNNNKEEFLEFSVNTFEQIFNLPLPHKFNGYNINYIKIAGDLLEYFSNAMEIAFALQPSFHEPLQLKITKVFGRFYGEFNHSNDRPLHIFSNWQKFRLSNMVRHNYVNIPLLNYTNISVNSSLLECDFSKIKDIHNIAFSPLLIDYSPRKVRFSEVAWMECIKRVYATKEVEQFQNRTSNDILFKEDEENTNYLEEAFITYFRINFWHKRNDQTFYDTLKKEIFDYSECSSIEESTNGIPDWKLVAHEISVNQTEQLKKLRVGLANMKVNDADYEASMLGKPNMSDRYVKFAKVLNEAEAEKCDLIVLPELSLPHGLVKTVMEYSWNHQRAVISGVEHWTYNNVAYNFILTILPCKIRGVNDAVPILRLKNHYAPIEEFWINDFRRVVPKPVPYRYHLLRWKGLYFTNYNCFELADIVHRSIFRSKIDFLVASELNRDVNFYSNITETTSRDLHCYFIQVNTSEYGDSRVTHPKKSDSKDSLRIKGGLNTSLLVDELDIEKLRAFQYKGFGQQKDDPTFKTTPADYNHDDACKRQENKSFKKTSS
ncbi:MAG: RNA-directed DNA polymerase [Flavobacterium sp.]|uniref:RNA-directed DNA polymerase n=1 Tax=Flavobacterium sp. TaxID=239 RepID=UPI00262E7C0C|nr:RNA-directed DNA polymerase [Flavobacterium sp.]MDD5151825.1 RNA-directed DNA polymerase [Flavobacterium sp.]